jgi:CHAT domain-containing protein
MTAIIFCCLVCCVYAGTASRATAQSNTVWKEGATDHYRKARAHAKKGEWQKAYDEYVASAEANEPITVDWYTTFPRVRAADIAQKRLGRLKEAIRLLEEQVEETPNSGPLRWHLAGLYNHELKDYPNAQKHYQAAVDAYEKNGDYGAAANACQKLSWAYTEEFQDGNWTVATENAEKAYAAIERGFALLPKITCERYRGQTRVMLLAAKGNVLMEPHTFSKHNVEKAIECQNEAYELATEHYADSSYIRSWLAGNMAYKYLSTGDSEKAIEYFKIQRELDPSLNPWASKWFSIAYHNLGMEEEAYNEIKRCLKAIESRRATKKSDLAKTAQAGGRWRGAIGIAIRMSDNLDRPDGVFESIETGKARAMLDLLGTQKISADRHVSASRKEELLLQAEIDAIEEQIEAERELQNKDRVASLQRSLVLVQKKSDALKADVNNVRQELASFNTVNAISLEAAQEMLDDDVTVVSYWMGAGGWAVVLTKDSCNAVQVGSVRREKVDSFRRAIAETGNSRRGLDIVSDEDAGKVKDDGEAELYATLMRTVVEDPEDREYLHHQSDAVVLGRELYEALIKPLEPLLNTRTVCFIPDGDLHFIPFHALHDGNKYLVEKHAVTYAPSASVLAHCIAKRKPARGKMLAVGNPNLREAKYKLAHAEKEVKAVGAMFPEARVLTGNQANEKAVKLLGGDYDVVHLACHGVLNPDDPMLSCLRLAPDKDNDGYLHDGEILDMRLNAGLVTLSACESGLGKITTGSEVLGLTRAVMFAGTPSVVASMWKVDDAATAELMVNFYQHLQEQDKADALRTSQVEMIQKGRSPYSWAPFYLSGDYK